MTTMTTTNVSIFGVLPLPAERGGQPETNSCIRREATNQQQVDEWPISKCISNPPWCLPGPTAGKLFSPPKGLKPGEATITNILTPPTKHNRDKIRWFLSPPVIAADEVNESNARPVLRRVTLNKTDSAATVTYTDAFGVVLGRSTSSPSQQS